ncbi:nucleotidyltransferase family protein [Bacillus shivajii]|uniref:nucleotidyltransferase family protein n=1 Tax=Bacillus shivajii TaxID=1983719 RepID=UPI001CFC2D43|nr:nucleotidyltransferase family protein [Bacillus shivajii]UCZ53497.1 nucleotidyltransferase family protein [Bacillus shivajii]
MNIKSEKEIVELVEEDKWMMDILIASKSLNLPDWWVCAGFVRSKIWDALHGFNERTSMPDIDVIYFDPANVSEDHEKTLEVELNLVLPDVPWSVKNQARMHVVNNIEPYTSSVDAISKFPETATALGLKLDAKGNVILTAPCGVGDVLNMEVKPTPFFQETKERAAIYEERLVKKNWPSTWSNVEVYHVE